MPDLNLVGKAIYLWVIKEPYIKGTKPVVWAMGPGSLHREYWGIGTASFARLQKLATNDPAAKNFVVVRPSVIKQARTNLDIDLIAIAGRLDTLDE